MNQDRSLPRQHIVRVEVGDGEVVDLGLLGPVLERSDLDTGAGGGPDPLTGSQVFGVDPLVEFRYPEGVSRRLAVTDERAGLRHIRFHDLRQSTAPLLLEQGGDLIVIKELLGTAFSQADDGNDDPPTAAAVR